MLRVNKLLVRLVGVGVFAVERLHKSVSLGKLGPYLRKLHVGRLGEWEAFRLWFGIQFWLPCFVEDSFFGTIKMGDFHGAGPDVF
jgi:hypothetical protein